MGPNLGLAEGWGLVVSYLYFTGRAIINKGCVKMFPPRIRADAGMVQCVSEGHDKLPGRKTVGTRRRASLSMQNPDN